MSTTDFHTTALTMSYDRPRRSKMDGNRMFGGVDPCRKSLGLEGVMDVLKGYQEYEGGINCSICGEF